MSFHSSDEMKTMMKGFKTAQDDQNILLQAVSSQVTIQGGRLRQMEAEVSEVKDIAKKLDQIEQIV